MNKSAKPTIFLILLLLLITTVVVLLSVGIKLKYEQALLQKDSLLKQLKTLTQEKIKSTAEYQTVTAEDRITKIASYELGLIKDLDAPVIIKYKQSDVEKIEEDFKRKYD
jgi:cell division protein FtsB